jgi:MoaA/NifB/PqqE/SkfB family radical SAM enzyme
MTTRTNGLVEIISSRIERSIKLSKKNFIWKKHALATSRKVFQGNDVDVDLLVEFLLSGEMKLSPHKINKATIEHKLLLMKALFGTLLNRVNEGLVSEKIVLKILDDRWGNDFFERVATSEKRYRKTYGRDPPGYVLISPGKHCNLSCEGCYASSTSRTKESLEYNVVKRIINESHNQWGSHLVAISGGEPLMYRSEGKGLFDLVREFPFMYFMVYTNGTLITTSIATKMAEAANISPAISIEGTDIDTDKRRGSGVYKKVMSAMANLRACAVPFGVSITATKHNIDTLLNPSFYDYFFDELKITYGWIFEYMPIGRGVETELMPDANERRRLFEVLDEQNKRGRFICDFWSTSPSAEGCIAAGRSSGYLYINWNGDVVPCVFNPYSDTNINNLYRAGGTLTDAVETSNLFRSIREWQNQYGFRRGEKASNLMAPCPIRDHFKDYRSILLQTQASGIDAPAEIALSDQEYYENMTRYGEEVEQQLQPIWDHRFCGKCKS